MTQPLPDRLARPFDLKTTILPTAVYLSLKEIFSIPKHGVLPIRLIDAFLLTKFPNATFFMSGNPLRVPRLPTEGDPPAAPVSPPTEVAPEGDPPPELCAELGGKAWLSSRGAIPCVHSNKNRMNKTSNYDVSGRQFISALKQSGVPSFIVGAFLSLKVNPAVLAFTNQ